MPCNITHYSTINFTLRDSITWDLIITWSLVGKARFVSVGIYHARASYSHRLPIPARAILSSPAVFKREALSTLTGVVRWVESTGLGNDTFLSTRDACYRGKTLPSVPAIMHIRSLTQTDLQQSEASWAVNREISVERHLRATEEWRPVECCGLSTYQRQLVELQWRMTTTTDWTSRHCTARSPHASR